MSENTPSVATILIVDDTPANLKLLEGMLRELGYRVRPFPRGQLALEAARTDPPDLILLDIMMPELDGYAVCKALKADARTREIPVLFLSALHELDSKVKAFEAGGVDYVTKPFQCEEVAARVRTHLELQRTRQELARYNRQLEESLAKQAELERLRDNLVHMMVHDMRSPLMGLAGNLEFIREDLAETLDRDHAKMLQTAQTATSRLTDMVSEMLDVSRLESSQMPIEKQTCDLTGLAHRAIDSLGALAQGRNISVTAAFETTAAMADPQLTVRVISNLLGNALKFTPASGSITLTISTEGAWAHVAVSDTGPGIPAEHHDLIFEKFGQVRSRQQGTKYSSGLGLTFCKLAVEAQGGKIGLESQVGRGSTFWIRLPLAA